MGIGSVYWMPLKEWAKRQDMDPSWSERLARNGRIVTPDGENAAQKAGRDWLVTSNAEWKRKRTGPVKGRWRRSPRKHLVFLPGPGEPWAWEKPETGDDCYQVEGEIKPESPLPSNLD